MAAYYSRAHICQCLTRISTLRRSSIITVTGDRLKTGELFVEGVLSLARGLLELGIQAGDVVAICAFNSDWYLEWLLAVAFVGGIVAPLNYRWSFEEAKSAMLTVEPVMLVRDDSCNAWNSELINDIITSLRWHVFLESSSSVCTRLSEVLTTEALRRSIKESPQMTYSWAPEAAVIVCFTSGTTGRPKGVMISHSALIVQSLAKVAIAGYSEDDVYLHTAPLCHIGGLSSAMSMLMVGASHILMPKFEATIAADAINKHFVTSLITVPAMMADMISVIRDKETWMRKPSVTKILNGGGSLTAELIKDANKCFPRARLLSAYGMTEACSSLAFICLYDPIHKIPDQTWKTTFGSPYQPQGVCVGKPAPHVELKICSDSYSPTGRILTRGPHLMLRYWDQKPKRLSDTNDEEVWLDTGDVGSIDDSGNIWLVGRANGRIKSGGENVYPEEVETILLQHPGITAAVIVGIPDSRLTEMVVACIKLRESWQWDDHSCEPVAANKLVLCNENLRIYCKEKNLTGFKIPKKFILWKDQFPLTTTGKIRRDQVRRAVMSHLQPFHSTL